MAVQLRTPSSSPPPPPGPALSTEINTATNAKHRLLNDMIMERLPKALPPNASNPRMFGQGLAAFAQIYITFESCWQEFIANTDPRPPRDWAVHQLLSDLRPRGLIRSPRLIDDIDHISKRTGVNFKSILATQQRPMLETMKRSIDAKPHLLLAYSWVMYLAIFSGGRHVRRQLLGAGFEFWTGQLDVVDSGKQDIESLEMPGFSFLYFNGEQDGEEIRTFFKEKFVEAETILTGQERQEVVQTAETLFDDCIMLVEMLDEATKQGSFNNSMPLILLCVMGGALVLLCRLAELV